MLDKILNSKQFSEYMQSDGVKVYKHFASISDNYVPTQSDAAMYLYESRGKRYCEENNIKVDVSGMVSVNNLPIGRSMLAQGKSNKDLTITLWLEDAGQVGFHLCQLEREMDEKLGAGWFYSNVGKRITKSRQTENYQKAKADMYHIPSRQEYYTGFKLWWIMFKEFPSKIRSKVHWMIWDFKKSSTQLEGGK